MNLPSHSDALLMLASRRAAAPRSPEPAPRVALASVLTRRIVARFLPAADFAVPRIFSRLLRG